MSSLPDLPPESLDGVPLVGGAPGRVFAFDGARRVTAGQFRAEVAACARALPAGRYAINLCEDRYRFLVAFCAVIVRGQVNLLPPSRAPQVIGELLAQHEEAYALGDQPLDEPLPGYHRLAEVVIPPGVEDDASIPALASERLVAIGFTSGSTGHPKPNPKTWGSFAASTRRNVRRLRALADADEASGAAPLHVVATVPPQHMYGMELSVLLPLLGEVAVHSGRPFFPAEIAEALNHAPSPRVLVTTPVHLRVLLESGVTLPPLAGVVSATAPLPTDLASAAEARFGTTVLELFGSTETCVVAHREPVRDDVWQLYDGVRLTPQPDGTLVEAAWFAAPVVMQDVVERLPGGRFRLQGRSSDLLEIAGKRASLGDLTRRLLAIPGVQDGVVFQSDVGSARGAQRIVALAVAPGLSATDLLSVLRKSVDPVFLPRPLRVVPALPRNETGKLPRAALQALLAGGSAAPDEPAEPAGD